jgi:kinesin family protein 11
VELSHDNFSSDDDAYVTINHDHGSINPLEGTKTYKVDQVYGSQANQQVIFDKVASPLLDDFIAGLNVTILCYGQTGTGKTYTMCGEIDDDMSGVIGDKSGIIPRALERLFRSIDGVDDYMVRCSYVELYNEELKDLLNSDDDKKLRIYENNRQINIQNLHLDHVANYNDGYRLLKRGSSKRKTASTKLNDVSSRSHAIFTIFLYKKIANDKFTVSKMNLVDLAGSENISRSGATNQRAKEAGSINQSLLTLGRVINSLSSSASSNHIPYRESKLTRLLQDSLGGSTKTALITTISPAKINVEETSSTLDYACKAKNIKNLPQSGEDNDILLKKVMVKNLSAELSKLTYDLIASRNKNGVYLDEQNYKQLIEDNEAMKTELKEAKLKVEILQMKAKENEAFRLQKEAKIEDLKHEILKLSETNSNLEEQVKHSQNSNDSLSVKVEHLTSECKSLKGKLHSICEENDILRANEQASNNKITDKNSEISKLNSELTKFHSKSSELAKLLYTNLDLSYGAIKSITSKLSCHSEQTCELVDMYGSELLKSVSEFKGSVNRKITEINNNWYDYSLNELDATILKFNSILEPMKKFFDEFMISFENNIIDNELAKFKFTVDQKLLESHLSNNTKLLEKSNETFSDTILKLLDQHNQQVHSMISSSITHLTKEIVESENADLGIQQKRYLETVNDVSKQADYLKTVEYPANVDRLHKLLEFKNQPVELDLMMKVPETTQIMTKLRDNEIYESLIKLGNNVLAAKNQAQEDDKEPRNSSKSPLKNRRSPHKPSNTVSEPSTVPSSYNSVLLAQSPKANHKFHNKASSVVPTTNVDSYNKAPSFPPVKSPIKRTSPLRSRTKIPQLLRSLSMNSDKENVQRSKKRRILEQVDNAINKSSN